LANGHGTLSKTDMAKFMNDIIHAEVIADFKDSGCIIDGMSIVQNM